MYRISAFGAAVSLLSAWPVHCAHSVEILGSPTKIELRKNTVYPVAPQAIAPYGNGGFGVIWGSGAPNPYSADTLFLQLYNAKRGSIFSKPKVIDGAVGGKTPTGESLAGLATLGSGRLLATWNASFPSDPVEFVGRLLLQDTKLAEIGTLDTSSAPVMGLRPLPLRDGSAVVAWHHTSDFSTAARRITRDGLPEAAFPLTPASVRLFQVAALDTGFAAMYFYRHDGWDELLAQVFDSGMKRQGGPILLRRWEVPQPTGYPTLVGLENGNLALIRSIRKQDGRSDIVAEVFSKSGDLLVPSRTLLPNLVVGTVSATYLPGGGFLLVTEDCVGEYRSLIFRRFDNALKEIKPAQQTKFVKGLLLGGLALLANGNVAATYAVNGQKVFVQTVKP